MKNFFETIILGVFCTIFAVYAFVSNARADDVYENWVECDAQVTDVAVTTDSDSPGNTRTWNCTLEYTREDGTSHVQKDVMLNDEVGEGATVPIMYDPDSSKIVPHGREENTNRTVNLIFGWGGAIAAAAFYLAAVVGVLRDKRKEARTNP